MDHGGGTVLPGLWRIGCSVGDPAAAMWKGACHSYCELSLLLPSDLLLASHWLNTTDGQSTGKLLLEPIGICFLAQRRQWIESGGRGTREYPRE